jgi:hypothetical protein
MVRIKRIWFALLLSVSVSVAFTLMASIAAAAGYEVVTYVLVWPGYLLESFVPGVNIGTESHPLYEATPVHLVAFIAGLLLQIPIYCLPIYVYLILKYPKNT